jgi:glycosyltransferase involved in cell wall biosynthesis
MAKGDKLHIAMVGLKGLPALSGGIERHVEEVGKRLVAHGHRVTVFCRPSYTHRSGDYLGMELVSVPSIATKHFDAITHTTLSALAAAGSSCDIVHYHAIGPSLVDFISRLAGQKTVVTVHSLDWQREKWGKLARIPLRFGEWTATKIPHATVAVSRWLADYLEKHYHRPIAYIPNGFAEPDPHPPDLIRRWGLAGGDYVLYVGRLTPEKGVHHLLEAHKRWQGAPPLVIAGSEQFGSGYTQQLQGMAARNVIFTGEISGQLLAELYTNTRIFVLPSDLEGHPIVLLEAMSYGLPIIASDIVPNREALDDASRFFRQGDVADLTGKLQALWDDEAERECLSRLARERATQEYNWDITVGQLEEVYGSIL